MLKHIGILLKIGPSPQIQIPIPPPPSSAWALLCFILSKIGFKNVTGGIDSHANVASAALSRGVAVHSLACVARVACGMCPHCVEA